MQNEKMSLWTYFYRIFRRYLLSPESFILIILLFIIYNTVVNISPLWERAKDRLRFTTPVTDTHEYNPSPPFDMHDNNAFFYFNDPGKTSWEFKEGKVAVYSIQGRRPHMEDRFKVYSNSSNLSMYGVFDGHGGEVVAEYVKDNLFPSILSNIKSDIFNIDHHKQVLHKQFLEIDDRVLQIVKKDQDISGSTALVAMVADKKLLVANVGDSRGVMCDKNGKTVPLSFDHKPNQAKEHERIRRAGGFVGFNGVWRVAGILATSRALGDYPLKDKNFVIADPDIEIFDLEEHQPQFIVLASDGLWDCFSNEEAVEYIKQRLDEPHFGAKSIILQAFYKGSLDNITVMVVKFDKHDNFHRKPS